MPSITSLVRSLGPDGAVTNAHRALQEREREDWLIAGFVHRIQNGDTTRSVNA